MCVCTVSCEDEMWIFLGARQPGVPRAFGLVRCGGAMAFRPFPRARPFFFLECTSDEFELSDVSSGLSSLDDNFD